MTVSAVAYQPPGQDQLVAARKTSPYSSLWWTNSYVSDVPLDSCDMMLAQGWRISSVSYDETTTPATPRYTMTRESLNNWMILQSLLNEYTTAYNEATFFNNYRYDQVIVSWTAMIANTQTDFTSQVTNSNTHVALYLSNLGTYMSAVEAILAANKTQFETDNTTVATRLGDYLTKLADFATNYTSHLAEIDALVTSEQSYLTTFLSDYIAQLANITSDFATHLAAIRTLETSEDSNVSTQIAAIDSELATQLADWTSHNVTSSAYFTDLGTTETARINEQWDGELAKAAQDLIDRGLYSTGLSTAVTARIERERSEALSKWNDQLAREKASNEHQLYEQKQAVRQRTVQALELVYRLQQALDDWKAGNETRLFGEHVSERLEVAKGIDRKYAAQVDQKRSEEQTEQKLYAELVGAVTSELETRGQHVQLSHQNAEFLAQNRFKVAVAYMDSYMKRLEGLDKTHDLEMKLLAYQLDERNKLLMGIYGFVEKRTDEVPEFDSLVKLAAGLGDSGGGWLTPS